MPKKKHLFCRPRAGFTEVQSRDWLAALGRGIARECMQAAVRSPSAGITLAIQRGWLAGLPMDELENCILEYLRASARMCDLAFLDQVIEECRPMLPEEMLRGAVAERKAISLLTTNLREGIENKDFRDLCSAIAQCETSGWPPEKLQPAYAAKCELQRVIGRLHHAQGLADVDLLSQVIEECEKSGMPERDMREAKQKRKQLLSIFEALDAATIEKDPSKLLEAINVAKACPQVSNFG